MIKQHFQLPSPMQTGIALGSNLGNSHEIFEQAIQQLLEFHQGAPDNFLASSFYKTTPVNCPSGSPDFLNAVVQLETSISPCDLIKLLQKIETETGRPLSRVKNTPRMLDLDLLYHGTTILNTDSLTLPHPKILEREFVLRPLAEIAPRLILPSWTKGTQEYLLDLKKK